MNKRKYILGDEWVYIKIYTGVVYADKLLTNTLYPLMKKLIRLKAIDKWFFVRYSDNSGYHLRLRCHVYNNSALMTVLQSLNKCLRNKVKNHLIHNVCYDTYNRELERYGQSNFEETESLFHLNSDAICTVLNHISSLEVDNEQERMKAALLLIYGHIRVLGLELEREVLFLKKNRDAFMAEFSLSNTKERYRLDKMYRQHKNFIESIFNLDHKSYIVRVVESHNKTLKVKFINIRDKILVAPSLYISTLIHMTVNRMFISSNREYELVIYYFLHKYYDSQFKRIKYSVR